MTRPDAPAASGEEYYETYYRDYERQNPPNKIAYYLSILDRHLKPGDSIFELGFGQGLFLRAAEKRYRCLGAEPNAYGVEQARRRVGALTELKQGSLECLPDRGVDAIVAFDVLEHLPDLDEALRAMATKLGKGRLLVGVVPVYDGPLGWLVRLLDHDPTHVTKVGRNDWLACLADAGFEVVEWGGIIRKLLPWRYVHLTAPQRLLRPAGSAMYFVARVKR